MTQPPANPKLYHIVHVDRLASIAKDGQLLCDAVMLTRQGMGTTIGMNKIKERRLQLGLVSRPGLHVGECVPFYYCPRSVMLFVLHRGNSPDLVYHGGQEHIAHLEFDLNRVVSWAESQELRWAITLSNAGARDFEDRCTLESLTELDWDAIRATDWKNADTKYAKQAEFLVEGAVAWGLIEKIGVASRSARQQALLALGKDSLAAHVEVHPDWYY